jgi:hypothetical protein
MLLISRCFPLICVRIAVHLILDWETELGEPGTAHVTQAAKPRASCLDEVHSRSVKVDRQLTTSSLPAVHSMPNSE